MGTHYPAIVPTVYCGGVHFKVAVWKGPLHTAIMRVQQCCQTTCFSLGVLGISLWLLSFARKIRAIKMSIAFSRAIC